MTTKIGLSGAAATVADPSKEYTEANLVVGSSRRTINATLITHFAGVKSRWTVPWRGLTSAERTTLWTELVRASHLEWQPPDGGTYTVSVESANWRRISNGRYEVDAELAEE